MPQIKVLNVAVVAVGRDACHSETVDTQPRLGGENCPFAIVAQSKIGDGIISVILHLIKQKIKVIRRNNLFVPVEG